MKTAKDYHEAKRVHFKPELRHCPFCGHRLRRSHTAWRKHLITLKGTFYATSQTYKCPNQDCTHSEILYRSSEAETLSLKYYQFSLEIIAKVGFLHFNKHQTLRQTKRSLREQHKIKISLSEVFLLSQAYLILVNCSRKISEDFIQKALRNGGVVLSIDGVQPEKGNESLYIIRDAITGEPLLAKNLESADTQNLAQLFEEVKAYGIPILGVVSDGQRSIRLAAAKVLPNVPHQLCHYHYLRNIAKPISDLDRALKTDLKMHIRGVKSVERRAKGENRQARVILQYCNAIRSAMLDDGLYPLKPGGLALYRRLKKIQQSIIRSENGQQHNDLERLMEILKIVDEFEPQYRRTKRLYKLIFEARDVLNQNVSREKVENDMQGYVNRLSQLRFRRREDKAALQNILKFTRNFWPGLFHHYSNPCLPRTNNALEVYIRFLKTGYRKTTGRAGCQGYLIGYGAYIVHIDWDASYSSIVEDLKAVRYEVFKERRRLFNASRCRIHTLHVTKNRLEAFLRTQEENWIRATV